ncbi:hypothetical protein B0J11DRAFT_25033 [Dendryphion nanum]|uniref:NACHT domain-containing protein n=1 Tax=Dendryphion nanum TaxID=256645 RepID=A0A9P9EKP7_9PLEO|nr:hypothetical protein B0J11DRAFT_25033 [Dendryphion nanum]
MKALPVVGLASSIIQVVDFSVRITKKDNQIYQPPEGELVENTSILQNVANNLYRLSLKLDQNDLKKLSTDPKRPKLSEAAEQILKLGEEAKELTATLIDAVLQAQSRGTAADPKWQTVREALSTVWKKKEITGIKKKFKHVRKEVDSVLLVALRQYLDQSAETGLPVFSEEDGRIHHVEKWQNDAMDAVHANDLKAKNKKNVEEFAKQVDLLIQAEKDAVFCDDIFQSLRFTAMDDRFQSIPSALDGTFNWFLEEPKLNASGTNFMEWLSNTNGKNLFWITGKPGAGKSVLIKHLYRNPLIFPSLEKWSGASPGIIAGFSFWSSGTELQRSSEGMLRSLLYESLQDMIYGPLQKDPGIIQWLFSDRWEQFSSYGGGMHNLTFQDLRRAFELMISDITKKFLFVIDGLDELEEYPEAAVDLLTSSAKRNNVKICTSSRDSPEFQTAFADRPTLELDLRTNNDIQTYVSHALSEDEKWVKICTNHSEEALEQEIIGGLVKKSSGVFLWASLSTEFLLRSVTEADDISSLQDHLNTLPSDLDALIAHIFFSLDQTDLDQAARLFRLVDTHGYPSLLNLSFAFDSTAQATLAADIRPLRTTEITKRVESLSSLLKNQCKSFLTIFEASPSATADTVTDPDDLVSRLRVNYSHRCIRDFLHSPAPSDQIHNATTRSSFNSNESWANASLWALKTLEPHQRSRDETTLPLWNDLAWCIEYALRLEASDKKVRVTYLDEVGRAAIAERRERIRNNETDLPEGVVAETFLDLAVWLNLVGYVSIKAKTAERKEIKHAIDYYRVVRKRIGNGGEKKWVEGRTTLGKKYETPAPELHQLLEYYAKPMRMMTPKPFVEIPEGV